jgi:dCTP deaminase
MLLNDRRIKELVSSHNLVDPFNPDNLNSFGYDLTLSTEFLVPVIDYTKLSCIDPLDIEQVEFKPLEGRFAIIPPNSFILGRSKEYVRMPTDLTGICLGRSTYARCGIITNVTPLEAGWGGHVTIEISNSCQLPAKVYANKGIVQVLFLVGDMPDRDYVTKGGRYQGQDKITLPRGL